MISDSCKSEKYNNYFGRRIGTFRAYAYGVQGTVYAIDESTIYIHDFYYNANGPGKLLLLLLYRCCNEYRA